MKLLIQLMLSLLLLTATLACSPQYDKVEIGQGIFGAQVVTDPYDVANGLRRYPNLTPQNAVIFVYPFEQNLPIAEQDVQYHYDIAFVNQKCKVVRVLVNVPPAPAPVVDEGLVITDPNQLTADLDLYPTSEPLTLEDEETSTVPVAKYQSGYPAKYAVMVRSPGFQEGKVLDSHEMRLDLRGNQDYGCK